MDIKIVFQDDWILIADKPAGLLTIPTPKNEARTLTSLLNQPLKEKQASYRLHPCHRLDRETSGLIIYAKGKSIQKKMMQMFKERKISKIYLAFLQGVPKIQGRINFPIEGRPAATLYRIIDSGKGFSVAEVTPLTGRKNQIRIHFKAIGHPIVGENRFAFRKDFTLRAKRACLHANFLEFIHPVTGKSISVVSALPQDLIKFLREHKD